MTTSQLLSLSTPSAMLTALMADLEGQPHSFQLAGVLQQRYSLPLLPLDIWNIVSLELIQAAEGLEIPFTVFQGRKQLCLDIQVSDLLKAPSLTELFASLKVDQINEEVILALLWDTPPSTQAIFQVLLRLTRPVDIHGMRLGAAGLVVGRQLVALGLNKSEEGVSLQGQGERLELSVAVGLRMLLQWELKPDLIMLKDGCAPLIPPLDAALHTALASLARQAEDIQLVAPVPSIVMREEKDSLVYEISESDLSKVTRAKVVWACACGTGNSQDAAVCVACGKRRYLQIDDIHEGHSGSESCAQCKALKAQLDDGKACPACGANNRSTARICKSCFVAFADVPTTVEWVCTACKGTNSGSRTYCGNCFASKTAEPQASPEARWTCENCQTVNSKGLSRCKNCLLKPGVILAAEKWTCRKCHFSNSSGSSLCQACSSSRDIAASVTETVKTEGSDYWSYKSCKGLNLPEKSRCRKCGNLRSAEQFDLSEEKRSCLNCGRLMTGRGSFCEGCLHTDEKPTWTCSSCSTVNSGGYCSKCFRRPK